MASERDLYVVLDRRGNVEWFSDPWARLAGWSSAIAVGRPLAGLVLPLEPAAFPGFDELDAELEWRGVMALNPIEDHGPTALWGTLAAARGEAEIRLTAEPVPSAVAPGVTSTDAGGLAELEPAAADGSPGLPSSLLAAPSHLNQQRLGFVLGHVSGFCYSVDERLVFTSSVGAGLRHLSLSDDQLVGKSLFELYGTRDPAYEPLACHFRALAGLPQAYQDVCMGRSLEYHIQPLWDTSGRVIGVVGFGQDVTEREAMKEALAAVRAQLVQAQKLEIIGRLAGGVAHDFNNLLTCILGNLTLTRRHVSPGSPGLRHLNDAGAAVDSAAALTRQLLALGRKQLIDPRPLDLGALVGRVEGMLRRLLEADITLRVEKPGSVCPVFADPGQLEQILINLVVNARDAIDQHGLITIGVERQDFTSADEQLPPELGPGRFAVLSVRDDGCGMSDAVRARVFEPYFTTKAVGEGTGLGLASVLGAVQQNNGAITVESALGRGSVFRIYLPRLPDDALPRAVRRSPEVNPRAPDELPTGRETILLVDDEPLVLEVAECTLQQLGYEVIPCSGSDEALRRFAERARRIDLLVTDVVMPRLNGHELAARVTALQPGISVLFTSAHGESIIARHGTLEPGVHFLGKPYRPDELALMVRTVLDGAPQSGPRGDGSDVRAGK